MSTAKLPPCAPRRLPPVKRAIKDGDIPTSVQPFLEAVYTVIQNRPRQFKKTPLTAIHPKDWWSCKEHLRATRWSLYRNLLKYSRQFERRLAQSNLQKFGPPPRNRDAFSFSPVLFNHIKSEFKRLRYLRSIPTAQEALRQGYLLLNNFLESEVGRSQEHLNRIESFRLGLVQTRHRQRWAQVYKSQLANKKPPTPIITGRFLRPTLLNGPLPRLVHQPLHISMMISSRRKKREKRAIEFKELKEKLSLIRLENRFEKNLSIPDTTTTTVNDNPNYISNDILDEQLDLEVQSILNRLEVINRSFELDKAREKKVYSRELLDKIQAARRRRPLVMRERNQWKRMKSRLDQLELAVNDDPLSPDLNNPESLCFSVPDSSFWIKKSSANHPSSSSSSSS